MIDLLDCEFSCFLHPFQTQMVREPLPPSPTLGACLRLATIKVNAAAAQPDVS